MPNVERAADPGRPYTRPGFLGYQLNGTGLGGGETLDLLTDNGFRLGVEDQSSPNRKAISLLPTAPVELARLVIDATAAPLDTTVITPTLPQHLGVVVEAIYLRVLAIAGLTSHPIFNLGFDSPAFGNLIPGMDLAAGGGAGVGEVRAFFFPDGGDVLEVPPSASLTLRLATAAVATTYSVEAFVFGRVLQP